MEDDSWEDEANAEFLDPADLPEVYRALQEAEAAGDVKKANELESLIEAWLDHVSPEEVTSEQ